MRAQGREGCNSETDPSRRPFTRKRYDVVGNCVFRSKPITDSSPGFGGQSFIPYVLDKVRAVRARIDALDKPIRLEVDGGVNTGNLHAIAAAGADTFVAGSAIFGAADYAAVIARMREILATVR